MTSNLLKPAVIGLGYVGLPLLAKISDNYAVQGFDISEIRLNELREGRDGTGELTDLELEKLKEINLTSNLRDLIDCNFYIITVPTPVTTENIPDFSFLESASESVGSVLRSNDIVVYEYSLSRCNRGNMCSNSGKNFGLNFNKDFFVVIRLRGLILAIKTIVFLIL